MEHQAAPPAGDCHCSQRATGSEVQLSSRAPEQSSVVSSASLATACCRMLLQCNSLLVHVSSPEVPRASIHDRPAEAQTRSWHSTDGRGKSFWCRSAFVMSSRLPTLDHFLRAVNRETEMAWSSGVRRFGCRSPCVSDRVGEVRGRAVFPPARHLLQLRRNASPVR